MTGAAARTLAHLMSENSFLLKNLVLFSRLLRSAGIDVGPGQVIDLAAALEHVDVGRREDFYYAARALCVHRRAQVALFDQAFNLFWQPRTSEPIEAPSVPNPALQPKPLRMPNVTYRELAPDDAAVQYAQPSERVMVDLQQTYSAAEVLRKKDFASFTWEEVQEAKRLMATMPWRIGERRTRRMVPAANGGRLDMRRVFRRNLRYGGEFLDLAWKRRKSKPRTVIVLCDISGSMEQYSRMLLHFLHTLSNELEQVEAFVFGTRLTRITRQIRRKDIDEAVGQVIHVVDDWGGGTRIGDAIRAFNYRWARRVRALDAVVLIISDGWDRGDTDTLGHEMARLQRSCFRLIWLNPLLASPDYEPLTQGLQAALPYVDDFLPVRNLENLEALGKALAEM